MNLDLEALDLNGLGTIIRKLDDLQQSKAVLHWDQETYMPTGGGDGRARQLATLSTLSHQTMVSDELGRAMEEASRHREENRTLDSLLKELERARRQSLALPEEFVREMSLATARGQQQWRAALESSDFSRFRDPLTAIVDLKKRHADYLGFDANPYDALIDLFEPGMTSERLDVIFGRLQEGVVRLLDRVQNSGREIDADFFFQPFDSNRQLAFATEIVDKLGFDLESGRVDLSTHPFCTSFGTHDVRLTTRVSSDDFRGCLFSLIHEAGHGLYEQGFDDTIAGTPLASGISMGIHESQSLFWEDIVSRSRPFWNWAFGSLQKAFAEPFSTITVEEFHQAINKIVPSFIRVEADELTYHLHIIMRYEIENALMNSELSVDDIPEVWNDKMTTALGITPSHDGEGCLQDVHWSMGAIGYFPSYSLGKLYASMFANAMDEDLDESRDALVERGEFEPIREWLRTSVHRWGKSKSADELVTDVCGETLTPEPFLEQIERRIDQVYGS